MLIFQSFRTTPMKKIETLAMLHVVTMTKLCRLFAVDMCERERGYILNMSSMSAWMAMPGIQCYNASKVYVLSFSKSLWYELRPRVLFKRRKKTCMPGAWNYIIVPIINHLPDWVVKVAQPKLLEI